MASIAAFACASVPSSVFTGQKLRASSSLRAQTLPRSLVVRAEAAVNPSIRKEEEKVADTVLVSGLEKPVTAYCRCWRSKKFPLCDGGHLAYNKESGDNVGPLVLKK
eukprot:TRINITY_DN964_c0_g1_i1.p1 TRINITY_DN964_c0_g1~~TRINITY_DN964_c0_g1_i1.p1  ORF type:complete len:120 (+),score=34.89 TRINITY_DN964_c0_g1_i1:42-362(+)